MVDIILRLKITKRRFCRNSTLVDCNLFDNPKFSTNIKNRRVASGSIFSMGKFCDYLEPDYGFVKSVGFIK